MKLNITHKTTYQYAEKVFVEPHHLYFYPLPRNYLTLLDFEIKVEPTSSGLAQRLDAEDNLYHQCWFNDLVDKIEIIVNIEVQTDSINPYNFLLEDFSTKPHNKALDIFLEKIKLIPSIKDWLDLLWKESDHNLVTFLSFLCKEINSQWNHESRYVDDILEPQQCFEERKGSCRDLSWMMIQMLRNEDIPARFVSGYAFNSELGEGHELHAWVEAWIAGAGWVGLDPSAGILATDKYVPIVTSFDPGHTFPVQGTFRGSAKSELQFDVRILGQED